MHGGLILRTPERSNSTFRGAESVHDTANWSAEASRVDSILPLPVPGLDGLSALLRARDDDSLSLFLSNEWAITKLFWKLLSPPSPNGAFDSQDWEGK